MCPVVTILHVYRLFVILKHKAALESVPGIKEDYRVTLMTEII